MDEYEVHTKLEREFAAIKRRSSEPLYSEVSYATGNTDLVKQFFAKSSAGDKTVTNVLKDMELNDGEIMRIDEIRVSLMPDAAIADIQEFEKHCVLKFQPNASAEARYFPIEILGAGGGPCTATTTVGTHGAPQQNAVLVLRVPEYIKGGIAFVCAIIHRVANTPTAATTVKVIFMGERAKSAVLAIQ